MVEQRQLIVVGIAGLRVTVVQQLRQLQHVVGVTGLGAVDVVDEVHTGILAGEMLAARVAAEGQRALPCDDVPEELGCFVVALIARMVADALEPHYLGHLRVGVHVVQTVHALHHRSEQPTMRETLGHVEILLLTARDAVGIVQHLVHATVLIAQHAFHLLVAEACRQVDGPVAEAQEEVLSLLVATVCPCVTQACKHLMQIIERGPRTGIHTEVTFLEVAPDALAVRHAAHVAPAPLRVVLHVGIRTELQLADHILHALSALLITHGGVHRHRRQIVATHMSVQPVPVGIGLRLGFQTGLLAIGSQQPVTVILQQRPHVQVACLLERTVEQGDITQPELIVIDTQMRHLVADRLLCVACQHNGSHAYQ